MVIQQGGNVGIGTDAPLADLDILGNLSTVLSGLLTATNGSASVAGDGDALFTTELVAGDAILLENEVVTVLTVDAINALTLTAPAAGAHTNVTAYTDSNLLSIDNGAGDSVLTINKTGNVGIGTTAPAELLDVFGGGVRVGTTANTNAGTIRYDSGDFQGYDGAQWVSFTAGAAGGEANTASSAGSGVSLFYQKAGVDLEFNGIKSENSMLTVALDGVTHDIELTVAHLGIENLSDPNADRILFWDDSAGASEWLTLGTNLSITGTTLDAAGGGGGGGPHTLDGADHTDVASITEAQGQILYYDGSEWDALAPGTDGQFLQTQGAAADPVWADASGGSSADSDWTVSGNNMYSAVSGNVGIGTTNPVSELAVNGTITAQKFTMTATGWADYVFDDGYKLLSLEDVETHIKANRHLPGIPSGKTVESEGMELGEMMKLQMVKIEELTLYLIRLNKDNEELHMQNGALTERLADLEEKVKE